METLTFNKITKQEVVKAIKTICRYDDNMGIVMSIKDLLYYINDEFILDDLVGEEPKIISEEEVIKLLE